MLYFFRTLSHTHTHTKRYRICYVFSHTVTHKHKRYIEYVVFISHIVTHTYKNKRIEYYSQETICIHRHKRYRMCAQTLTTFTTYVPKWSVTYDWTLSWYYLKFTIALCWPLTVELKMLLEHINWFPFFVSSTTNQPFSFLAPQVIKNYQSLLCSI